MRKDIGTINLIHISLLSGPVPDPPFSSLILTLADGRRCNLRRLQNRGGRGGAVAAPRAGERVGRAWLGTRRPRHGEPTRAG